MLAPLTTIDPLQFRFEPVTPARWDDLETLFGPRGACGGCWCMFWRQTRAEHTRHKGESNRDAFREIVMSGDVPGILAYDGDTPVGWCSVAPREEFPSLARSRTLNPVDDTPVWSITCLYIARAYRRRGVSSQLVDAAVRHALARGADVVEAYPVEPRTASMPDPNAWTGIASTFVDLGFIEVARRSPGRPILRFSRPVNLR